MRQFVILILCSGVLACAGVDAPSASRATNSSLDKANLNATASIADTYYYNGVIWTGQEGAADASVMVVKDGKITYVGDGRTVRIAAKRQVDLDGRFVMPGFIDNHVHFFEGGMALASVELRDANTPEEFIRRIGDYSASLEPGRWVLNGNWDHQLWGGELPHKDWIDKVTGDRPVFIIRLDGHMALANSAALKLAGITAETITPKGGEIVRDDNGEPTGILKDTAMFDVSKIIPQPSEDELVEHFERAQTHALSLGLTQVHAVVANEAETWMLDAFENVYARGKMKLRVNLFSPLESWQSASTARAKNEPFGGMFKVSGVKGFVDGSLGSSTAWFHAPYLHEPDKNGFPLAEPAQLKTQMADADRARVPLAIHAIGDRAIDLVIENMQDIAGDEIRTRRYRIEHFQHPTFDAIQRLADSGIIASMHPYHAIDDGRWAEERIGNERIQSTYAFRSVLDAGGILSFGSDWPVAPLAPLKGVYAAVTRRTTDGAHPAGWQPQQKITVDEALRAYTTANAYAVFEENKAGTLEAGKRADFIVLGEDPRTIKPETLSGVAVEMTVIAGEVVFSKEDTQ